jgi:hypothetical protein
MHVERTPVSPIVIRQLQFAAKCFESGALGLEIFAGDGEGEMIDCRLGRAQAGIARLAAPVEESQDLSVSAVTVRNLEEGRIRKASHQLQADDVLIKSLHGIEVVYPQRNFTQRFDLARCHADNLGGERSQSKILALPLSALRITGNQSWTRPNTIDALIPPKPNELLIM